MGNPNLQQQQRCCDILRMNSSSFQLGWLRAIPLSWTNRGRGPINNGEFLTKIVSMHKTIWTLNTL